VGKFEKINKKSASMGATQSSTNDTTSASSSSSSQKEREERRSSTTTNVTKDYDDDDAATATKLASSSSSLSGMALVNYTCRKKKRRYDVCVTKYYDKQFLKARLDTSQEEKCGDKFELYRECVLKGIRKEIWDKNEYPPPKEGSPLAEVGDDDQDD